MKREPQRLQKSVGERALSSSDLLCEWLKQQELGNAEDRSQNVQQGLPHGQQGPTLLDCYPLPLQALGQEAEQEAERPGPVQAGTAAQDIRDQVET